MFLNIVAGADELVTLSGTTQQNVAPAENGRTSVDADVRRVSGRPIT